MKKARSWWGIGREMVQEYLKDDGPFLAAGIAFHALFSLFPLALIAVSVLSYLLPAHLKASSYTLEMAHYYLPPNVLTYIEATLTQMGEDRGKLGAFGLLILLWSGRHLFRALELGLHRAWQLPRNRNLVTGNLIAILVLMLCALITFAVSLLSGVLSSVEAIMAHWEVPRLGGLTLDQAQFWAFIHHWLVTPLATLLVFLLLYVILPSRQVPLAHALPGAIFATVAWKLATWLYLTFIIRLLQLNPIYGSIWSLAGLMIWLYLGAVVFLMGAELVHVLYRDEVAQRPKKKRIKKRARPPLPDLPPPRSPRSS